MNRFFFSVVVVLIFIWLEGLPVKGQAFDVRTDSIRERLIKTATSQVGVREKTGHNDGAEVESYLHSVGLVKGYAWCAAFLVWCHDQNGIKNPRTAWAPDWFRTNVVYKSHDPSIGQFLSGQFLSKKGQVFGLYFEAKGRIAHVGMLAGETRMSYITIEGNTNQAGSREGDGVYKKLRDKKTIYIVSDYCDPVWKPPKR